MESANKKHQYRVTTSKQTETTLVLGSHKNTEECDINSTSKDVILIYCQRTGRMGAGGLSFPHIRTSMLRFTVLSPIDPLQNIRERSGMGRVKPTHTS